MKTVFYLLILLTITSIFKSKKSKKVDEDRFAVVSLNEENALKYISMYPKFFLYIHSPWCQWSQKFHDILPKINENLELEPQSVYLGKIDATITKLNVLKDVFPSTINPEIINYPKLFYIENGLVSDSYNGRINFDSIFIWIRRKIHPLSQEIALVDSFNFRVKIDKHSVILFSSDQEVINNFNLLASENKKIAFYNVKDSKLNDFLNPHKNMTAGYYRYGKLKDSFNTKYENEDLRKLISKHLNKNFYDVVNEEVIDKVFINKNPALVFFISKYDDEYTYYSRTYKLISQEKIYSEIGLNFILTDIDSKYSLKLANFFGFRKPENLPTIRIVDHNGDQFRKFSLTRNITKINIVNFIEKWRNNEIQPYTYVESFEAETNRAKGSVVRSINYNSFYEIVTFNKKNVIVLFYTDWCSLCKKLFVTFENLSKRFNKDLISFVTINLQNYENNLHGIKQVPSIYLYSSKDKEHPIIFDGNFLLRDLIDFITSNIRISTKTDL